MPCTPGGATSYMAEITYLLCPCAVLKCLSSKDMQQIITSKYVSLHYISKFVVIAIVQWGAGYFGHVRSYEVDITF